MMIIIQKKLYEMLVYILKLICLKYEQPHNIDRSVENKDESKMLLIPRINNLKIITTVDDLMPFINQWLYEKWKYGSISLLSSRIFL